MLVPQLMKYPPNPVWVIVSEFSIAPIDSGSAVQSLQALGLRFMNYQQTAADQSSVPELFMFDADARLEAFWWSPHDDVKMKKITPDRGVSSLKRPSSLFTWSAVTIHMWASIDRAKVDDTVRWRLATFATGAAQKSIQILGWMAMGIAWDFWIVWFEKAFDFNQSHWPQKALNMPSGVWWRAAGGILKGNYNRDKHVIFSTLLITVKGRAVRDWLYSGHILSISLQET